MAGDQVGQTTLRAQFFDKAIKQITKESYVMKQAVAIISTDAWVNFFWREDRTVLAGAAGNTTDGIPRLANFPQASANWERISTILNKYGLEENISWEDIRTNEIDVMTRTSIKIAEGVASSVDKVIYSGLSEKDVPANIQTVSAYAKWSEASAAIIDDLLQAAEKIKDYNYPTDELYCFVTSKDKRRIMNYLAGKGAQFPTIATDVTLNGSIGRLAGITLIESKAVTASKALVVVPKRCATWKENQALTTVTTEDPYKSVMVRAVEMGTLQLTDPKAVVLITGTQ